MADQGFCPIGSRVPLVMEKLEDAKDETGREVIYAVNVTTRPDRIVERAAKVCRTWCEYDHGRCFYDRFWRTSAARRDPAIRVPVYVHRTMHAALTRYPGHGIALRPFAQIVRLLGADQFQTGSVTGKSRHDSAR